MMTGFLDQQETRDTFRASRAYTRRYAKSFYFASHVLPKEKRLASYAIYAFCRYADNIIDDAPLQGTPAHAMNRINDLRRQLGYVYARSRLMHPRLQAFQETVFRYQVPESLFLDLLRGVEMDLTVRRYESFPQLEEYCYCVASAVGLVMTRVFGYADEKALEHAQHLGLAMQLTNILRDIGEDYERGRIYLPAGEMERFGVTERHLRHVVLDDSWNRLMSFQIERARRYYAKAEPGIQMLDNDGSRFCVRLMSRIYAGILGDIERNGYDVFGYRAHVPGWKKAQIAAGVLLAPQRHRDDTRPDKPDVPQLKQTVSPSPNWNE